MIYMILYIYRYKYGTLPHVFLKQKHLSRLTRKKLAGKLANPAGWQTWTSWLPDADSGRETPLALGRESAWGAQRSASLGPVEVVDVETSPSRLTW